MRHPKGCGVGAGKRRDVTAERSGEARVERRGTVEMRRNPETNVPEARCRVCEAWLPAATYAVHACGGRG